MSYPERESTPKVEVVKKKLSILLKFLFAAGLIYWLVERGALDFSYFSKIKDDWPRVALFVAAIIGGISLTSFRWYKLIQIRSKTVITPMEVNSLTWIGVFFSSFIPGGVSGDFVKIFYARKIDPQFSYGHLFASSFIDRLFGLFILIFIQGIISLIFYTALTERGALLSALIHFNLLLLIPVLIFSFFIFLPIKFQTKIEAFFNKHPKLPKVILDSAKYLWGIGSKKGTFLYCVLISFTYQMINVVGFYFLIAPYTSGAIHLQEALSIIPLGLISMAIPLTPMGIGVGHVVFEQLFSLYGVTNGASLFNIYLFLCALINLLGVIPYILYRKEGPPPEKLPQESVARPS